MAKHFPLCLSCKDSLIKNIHCSLLEKHFSYESPNSHLAFLVINALKRSWVYSVQT